MGILLDTDVFAPPANRRFDLVAALRRYGDLPVGIAAVSAAELLSLADPNTISTSVESLLRDVPVVPFDVAAAREYARLWSGLPAGSTANLHDLMVAATALARDWALLTLHPARYAEFEGVVLAPA